MILRKKTLEFQFIVVSSILFCILLVLVGKSIKKSLESRKLSDKYTIKNKITGHLNTAAGWHAIERGYGATILGSGKGDSSPLFSNFLEMGKKGDSEVFQAERYIKELIKKEDNKILEKELSIWSEEYQILLSARPKIAGNDISRKEWFNATTVNINNEFDLRDVTFASEKMDERIIYMNNVLGPNIAKLCEFAGLERALIANTIASGKPISNEIYKEIKRYRTVVEHPLDQILQLKELLSTSDLMKQALLELEKEFLQSFQLLREDIFNASKKEDNEVAVSSTQITKIKTDIKNYLSGISRDLLNVSNHANVTELAKSVNSGKDIQISEQQSIVTSLFEFFSQVHKTYNQIQFIDRFGHERVHVDFSGNNTHITPLSQLKDRSEKHYFKETINMLQESVYISPIELNIENENAEIPYNHIIHFATPVFVDGKQAGIVVFKVITYADNPFLSYKAIDDKAKEDYILTDQNGFYLHHPDKAKEWGMVESLNKSHQNIRQDYPDVAEQILSGNKGVARLVSGEAIVYEPFCPEFRTDTDKYWIIIKQVQGVDYPVSASAWFDAATKAINTGFAISKIAEAETTAFMSKMESNAKRNLQINLFVFAFVILVILFFIRWARTRILNPIQKLTSVTQKISEGDYSLKAEVESRDEIGLLTSNFNKMAEGLTNEIADRKHAEKLLRKSEENYRQLIEAAQDVILAVDVETGIILDANTRVKELLGIPVKEMVGMHHTQTYPPKEAKRAEEILKKYTQIGKGITSEEIFVQHRDGCKIPVEISFSVFEIGGKKTILGIFRDITERKKSQNELKKSEIRYRQLFEDSPIAIWEEDFSELKIYFDKLKEEGVQDFYKYFEKNPDALKACLQKARVLDVNKAALKLYKAENKEELLGNLNKTFTEKSLQVFKEEIIAIAEGANRFEAEAVVKTLTGENRYIYLRLYLGQMKENNLNYSRALVVTNDITEQKKMENALLLSEKMKSMGIVTSGVAHEFNNILAIVKGFALQIKKKCGDDNKLEKRVDTIIKASNDGVEIVRRMREYTNIEMDNTDFAPADVRSLIKQAIEFTTPRWLNIAHANSINYKINADDCSEVLCVMGNQSELREVLINIINNALDAMPDGGSLSYRTWGKENMVFVSISDTGTGMGKNIQEKLFDPFFTTKAGVGTGLGMSVAYGIITRHGGKIDVESEEGVGSTFTIRLPMSKETVITEDADESEQEIKAEGLRILIVDDEQKICDLLSEHFLEDGHTVKSVNSGSMAIKLLRTENFDLVLSDLVMPEVSGHDIIKAVGMLEKKPKVGIITGWANIDSTGKGEALKADFIVKKPIDFSELTLCINNVLSKYSSYDIGIAEIDIQHADMDLLLSKLSEKDLSQDIEEENFELFRNAVSSHFDFEEKWAQTNNKIFDADHLKAHNELLELLNEMDTQYRNKQLNMNTICLTIKKKLLSHVRNHDIRMITI